MPGPRNAKKKAKAQAQQDKRQKAKVGKAANADLTIASTDPSTSRPVSATEKPASNANPEATLPVSEKVQLSSSRTPEDTTRRPPLLALSPKQHEAFLQTIPRTAIDASIEVRLDAKLPNLAEPCIYDPGSGPRVRDLEVFLASYWAVPPSLEDEMCAAFAEPEVLDMLVEMPGLGKDLALVSCSPSNHLQQEFMKAHSR
jgi:hypothetical protein